MLARASIAQLGLAMALAGCTLIDLSQLGQSGGPGGQGGQGADASTNHSGAGGPGSGANGVGGEGAASSGGGPPAPGYEDCLGDELPQVYLRMSSDAGEPNLGVLGGQALATGTIGVVSPGLVDGDDSARLFTGASHLSFDGASQLFGGTQPLSVELWFRADAMFSQAALVSHSAGAEQFEVRLTARAVPDGLDSLSIRFHNAAGLSRLAIHYLDLLEPPDQLHHLVAIYRQSSTTVFNGAGESNDMALYLDGALVTELTVGDEIAMPSYVAPVTVGSAYEGRLDEVAIYDRELSADEVMRHYLTGTDAGTNCGTMSP